MHEINLHLTWTHHLEFSLQKLRSELKRTAKNHLGNNLLWISINFTLKTSCPVVYNKTGTLCFPGKVFGVPCGWQNSVAISKLRPCQPPPAPWVQEGADDHGDAAPTLVGRMALIDKCLTCWVEPGRKKNRQFFVKLLTFSKISPSPQKVSSSTVQQVSHQSSKLRESRFGNHIGTTPRKLTNIVWRTDDWKMRSSFEKWCLLWETVPEKNIQKYAFCQSTLITESYCHMIILNRCQPWSANR